MKACVNTGTKNWMCELCSFLLQLEIHTVEMLNISTSCYLLFVAGHKSICAPTPASGLSGGSIFLIMWAHHHFYLFFCFTFMSSLPVLIRNTYLVSTTKLSEWCWMLVFLSVTSCRFSGIKSFRHIDDYY